ncbi:YoaK family protein [Pseudobowmanella zhangzhouensis]|uniref:YoaK family protein n=1 Tax=Pseudobowmanella zhangzhouensis TaxID=1537679 RepID=UPI0036190C53
MINQLPRWVEYGAFLLALIAGTVNAVGLLGVAHQSLSHLSGIATLSGIELAAYQFASVVHLLALIGSFVAGAALSGWMLSGRTLKLGRHYDTLLVYQGLLLLGAMGCLLQDWRSGQYLASAACGLQNALATNYSGAIIRTTHLTGIFTDLGLMLGARLKGDAFDRRKGALLLSIVAGFILGGVAGSALYLLLSFWALAFPALLCLILALLYNGYRRREILAKRHDGAV